MSDYPFVSRPCPTYRRPALLANALACYLAQDYPAERRELLIVDDAGQLTPQQGNGFEVISMRRRFGTLPEKFNALAGLARAKKPDDVLVVFEDDDIYLPWHIMAHVEGMRPGVAVKYSKPSRVQTTCGGVLHHEPAGGRFHASIAFTRAAFELVGGWPITRRGDFDLQMLARLRKIDARDPAVERDASYVFRWETTKNYHGQGAMRGPGDPDWYDRLVDAGTQPETPHAINLFPCFDAETQAILAKYEATK